MNEEKLGEEILNHYDKYLGDYFQREVYRINDALPSIQLLKYSNIFENCMTYATIGVSNYEKVINNKCEIVMIVDDSYDECADLFANALFYVINKKIEFGRGIVIDGVDNLNKDFSAVYDKSAFYFTETYVFPDGFSHISHNKKMYMAFLISQRESEFIKNKGADKFEDLLESMECDVFDIRRKSIIN